MEKMADALLATEWWRASEAELLVALSEMEELARRVYAHTLALHAEAEKRGVTGGYDCTRVVVHDAARISIVETIRRENHIELIEHSPAARDALAAGVRGADYLDVITKTMKRIPSSVGFADREMAESQLLEPARILDALALKRAARHILDWLGPDGPEAVDDAGAP